ncbi:hypothetical protein [Cupriavidus sp. AU9028]|uniref:hypothetical protein n=1 Tax=Cupriavidus sp. AU9028 TaxID=2871157 RepID=UPI001C980D3B|nr:hypothetical protein [Cupriavidus sp. AU9028]MBY4895692.1 hypothetical protein [Cupriavidus sp. AU9028]
MPIHQAPPLIARLRSHHRVRARAHLRVSPRPRGAISVRRPARLPADRPSREARVSGAGTDSQRYRLRAGASQQIHATAGSLLHVTQGCLELVGPPCWMAETVYWPTQRVGADGLLVLPADGRYILRAHVHLDVTLHRRRPHFPLVAFARILVRCWGWLIRHRRR